MTSQEELFGISNNILPVVVMDKKKDYLVAKRLRPLRVRSGSIVVKQVQ